MSLASPSALAGGDGGSLFCGATATEPTLSVAGVTDGEVATVTAGARSLSITAQSGATLLTTVNDKDGAVTVTGSTTATPSWTAPSGGTTGNACQVHVTATLGGLVSEVSRTELVVGSGGGGGASEWSQAKATDFTASSTGSLSSGSAVIDGATYDVTVAGGTVTDDANGIRFVQSSAGFSYLGTDVNNLVTDTNVPFWFAYSFDDLTIGDGGNVGIALYSATTPDASVVAPSFQLRVNRSGASYRVQLIRTSGGATTASALTIMGSTTLASAPTSMVLQMYVVGSMVYMAYNVATTTIPTPTALATVAGTPATYGQASGATGGWQFTTPGWWPRAWATVVVGSGSGVAITADVLAVDVQEMVTP